MIALTHLPLAMALAAMVRAAPGDWKDLRHKSKTPSKEQSYYPDAAECVEVHVPVPITAEVVQFAWPKWDDDYALVDFLAVATTREDAGVPSPINGTKTEKATYDIAASFCSPKKKTDKAKQVILATHGIGQARSHWNSPFRPDEYNFVQHAIGQGYSVFFYDRLGQGSSQKVSGYMNQINVHSEVLKGLTKIVKSGEYTKSIGKPSKLAIMGFSFGSYITHAAISSAPDIADAVVLTAIGLDVDHINANGLTRSFVPRIANKQDKKKFGEFDNGYLTWVDKFAQINTYFKRPFYDAETADFAEAAKQPFGIAEFFTFPTPNGGDYDASKFTGAALTITGELDYIVCDGDCRKIEVEPASTFYRNAKPFVPYLHPNASHNINFHHNATGAYKVITGFLDQNFK